MKNNSNETTITLSDAYWDKVVYNTTDLDIHTLTEVFIRIARHMEYADESIEKWFRETEIIDNY